MRLLYTYAQTSMCVSIYIYIYIYIAQQEAVDLCNESPLGLQASVFTQSINSAIMISDSLQAGTVQVQIYAVLYAYLRMYIRVYVCNITPTFKKASLFFQSINSVS